MTVSAIRCQSLSRSLHFVRDLLLGARAVMKSNANVQSQADGRRKDADAATRRFIFRPLGEGE